MHENKHLPETCSNANTKRIIAAQCILNNHPIQIYNNKISNKTPFFSLDFPQLTKNVKKITLPLMDGW